MSQYAPAVQGFIAEKEAEIERLKTEVDQLRADMAVANIEIERLKAELRGWTRSGLIPEGK
jgi:hypothetical protein